MKNQNHSLLFKISLLSISALLMVAPIISAALPLMFEAFPQQSMASVEMLLTVPNFGIILSLLLSPLLVQKIGKKKTILIGLTISLVSGLLPVVITSYPVILVSRFVFGMGIGLFNSLAVSLLAEFFSGDELSTMMGFQSMMGSLGSASLSFLISYLVTLGWQQTFLAYLIIVPILFLFARFVPIEESDMETETQVTKKTTFQKSTFGLSIFMFFLFSFFIVSVIKLPELIVTTGIGTTSSVSLISGVTTLVGIPVGVFYGKIHKTLKNTVLPIGLLIGACGFFIVSIATTIPLLLVGVVSIGIGFGISIPFIYTLTAMVTAPESVNLAYTSLIISTNIGVFFSPILFKLVGTMFNNHTPQFSMLVACGGFLSLSLLTMVLVLWINKQKTLRTTKENI